MGVAVAPAVVARRRRRSLAAAAVARLHRRAAVPGRHTAFVTAARLGGTAHWCATSWRPFG
eukprot:scaffold5414_cov29-Phaeocystis_antarctica.AAC.1